MASPAISRAASLRACSWSSARSPQAAAIPLAIEDPHSVRTFALLEAADAVRVLGFTRLPEHRIAQAVWLLAEATAATRPGGPAAQPSAGAVTSAVASLEGDRLTG